MQRSEFPSFVPSPEEPERKPEAKIKVENPEERGVLLKFLQDVEAGKLAIRNRDIKNVRGILKNLAIEVGEGSNRDLAELIREKMNTEEEAPNQQTGETAAVEDSPAS